MEGKRIAHLMCLMVMLTSAGSADDKGKLAISTEAVGDQAVKITCTNAKEWKKDNEMLTSKTDIELDYNDDNSGEYKCIGEDDEKTLSIYVKFRTCDNCVALDVGTVVGIVVGECVATALIGVAVYLLASQSQGKVYRQVNKASDRQNLLQNQQNDSTYQPLSHGGGAEYSQLEPRRGRKN